MGRWELTLPQIIVRIGTWIGYDIDETRAKHVITQSIRMSLISAGPIIGGMIVDAYFHAGPGFKDPASGDWVTTPARNLHDVFAYLFHGGHIMSYVIIQVLAPAIGATVAGKETLNGRRSSDSAAVNALPTPNPKTP